MLSLLSISICVSCILNYLIWNNRSANFIVQIFCYLISALLVSYAVQNRNFAGDTINYLNTFLSICNTGYSYPSLGFHLFNLSMCDVGFNGLLFIVPLLGYLAYISFLRISIGYLIPIYFILIIVNISFLQLNSSGIRQGISISLILMSILFMLKGNIKSGLVIGMISTTFHWATLPFLFLIVITTLLKDRISIKYLILLFMIVNFGSLLGIFEFFSNYASIFISNEDKMNAYVNNSSESLYRTGFRLDFFLYSLLPVIIVRLLAWRVFTKDERYKLLFFVYIVLNSAATFLNFIPFSDRMYAYSWSMIPIIILYTIHEWLKNKEGKEYILVLLSLVMIVVFYTTFSYNFRFLESDMLWN